MKAIILAGGEATRLRPLTLTTPKALIDINGKTLTEHVIEVLKKYGVKDFLLSVAYKKEKIKEYFKNGKHFGINIGYIDEDVPLGTAGPLIILNREKKQFKERFFMVNGDNLFNLDLKKMLNFHIKNNAVATIALTKVKDVSAFGVAKLDGEKIVEFVEKPKPEQAPSHYINSGYYILEPEVFDIVIGLERAMIERDVFPILAKQKKLFGFKSDGLWFDTGTFDRYEEVKKKWVL